MSGGMIGDNGQVLGSGGTLLCPTVSGSIYQGCLSGGLRLMFLKI